MQGGVIVPHLREKAIVQEVFSRYLAGENLNQLAESLMGRNIEYLPGEIVWNKSRIKRMLEDRRYLGIDMYEAIIDESTFAAVNSAKTERRSHSGSERSPEDKRLCSMVLCDMCGHRLFYRIDNSRKCKAFWYCKNQDCKCSVQMSLPRLREEITTLLNCLIEVPLLGDNAEIESTDEPTVEVRNLENEIAHATERTNPDADAVQAMILRCAETKYAAYSGVRHITDRLTATLQQSEPLSAFSPELTFQIANSVAIYPDQSAVLVLKDGRKIAKEPSHERKPDENGSGDPAEA